MYRFFFLEWGRLDYGVDSAMAGLVVLALPCLGRLNKGFTTHLAHMVLCALVSFDVVFKLVRLQEHFRAVSTSKFFHTKMLPLMAFSTIGSSKGFITAFSAL